MSWHGFKKNLCVFKQYSILCLITLVCVFLVFGCLDADWLVMFDNQSDAIGLATAARNYRSGIDRSDLLEAPFSASGQTTVNTYFLHNIWLWLLAKITVNSAQAANMFYVSGYLLVSCSMYFVLKKMKITSLPAGVSAIIYTFLPYHYLRGECHVYLGMYYLVPPACFVILRLLEGRIFFGKRLEKEKKVNFVLAAGVFAACGCSDIYYSVFACILILFAGIVCAVKAKKMNFFWTAAVLCMAALLPILFMNIPYLASLMQGQEMTTALSERSLADLEIYGLRLSQLLLPIQEHRIGLLADLRAYYESFLDGTESRMATLGFAMSVGFCISIGCVFAGTKKKKYAEIEKLGQLNLFCILLAGIGGLNVWIGLISAVVRCYNRVSVFMAAFSVMTLAVLLQSLYDRLAHRSRMRIGFGLFAVFAGILAVLDQTPGIRADKREENVQLDANTRLLVEKIEAGVPEGSMIFMLPLITQDEDARIHDMRNYEQQWPAVYSDDLRWSAADNLGIKDPNRQWKRALACMKTEEMLEHAAAAGFEGIWMDRNGYTEEAFPVMKEKLEGCLGEPLFRSTSGKQFYYSLTSYTRGLKMKYTGDEWERKKKESLELGKMKGDYYGSEQLCYTGSRQSAVSETLSVENGEIQYGPYCSLQAGKYRLQIHGGNLNSGDFSITCGYGEENIPFEIISASQEQVTASFAIDCDKEQVEFVMCNQSEVDVDIGYYYVESDQ